MLSLITFAAFAFVQWRYAHCQHWDVNVGALLHPHTSSPGHDFCGTGVNRSAFGRFCMFFFLVSIESSRFSGLPSACSSPTDRHHNEPLTGYVTAGIAHVSVTRLSARVMAKFGKDKGAVKLLLCA